MFGLPAIPGMWSDYYACMEDNIVETINYMLNLHKEDTPTACVGFTIIRDDSIVRIYPKVRCRDLFIYDYYTDKKTKLKNG